MQDTNLQQTIQLKKEKVIKGLSCPSCGGELNITEGIKTFNCKYCNSLLVVKGTTGSVKYYVPRKINKNTAIKNTFEWLGSGFNKARKLKKLSVVTDAFPIYVPFWRVSADVVGWIFGKEKKTDSKGNTTYEDVEKEIKKSYDRTYPACNISELGVKRVNLTGDEILPVDFEILQQDSMLFNIISSESDIFDYALKNFTDLARSEIDLYEVTFEHYDLVRKKISIIYYPLWVVRYVFANRIYQVVVDGEDGTICYGKAPGNNLYRAIRGILGTAIGIYLITFFGIFSLMSKNSDNMNKFVILLYVFSVIGGIASIRSAWKHFRYGGEIVEGTGIEPDENIKKPKLFSSASNQINISQIGNSLTSVFNIVSSMKK
jgi:DNA-directed RNA polymerase subunit RPC12/RpoP